MFLKCQSLLSRVNKRKIKHENQTVVFCFFFCFFFFLFFFFFFFLACLALKQLFFFFEKRTWANFKLRQMINAQHAVHEISADDKPVKVFFFFFFSRQQELTFDAIATGVDI